MKTKWLVAMLVGLGCSGLVAAGQGRPYLGVLLDDQPLPALLTKHLQLDEGQGVRIRNVQKDSPADRAGLERDDIVIAFQGEKVMGLSALVDAVRAADAEKPVSLEVIHLGQRKTLEVRLGRLTGEPTADDWKYPPEPRLEESWMPGRVFRLGPDGREWEQLDVPDIERQLGEGLLSMQQYRFKHVDGDEVYDVRIEGNPHDSSTRIRVEAGDEAYDTTVKDVAKLPKDVRRIVEESLRTARESSRVRVVTPPHGWNTPDTEPWRRYFYDLRIPERLRDLGTRSRDEVLERLEKQMKAMQERMERYEQRTKELYERLLDRLDRHNRTEDPDGSDEDGAIDEPRSDQPPSETGDLT